MLTLAQDRYGNILLPLTEQKVGQDHLLCYVETAFMVGSVEENRESRAESGAGCAAELRRSEQEFLRRNLVAKNNFSGIFEN